MASLDAAQIITSKANVYIKYPSTESTWVYLGYTSDKGVTRSIQTDYVNRRVPSNWSLYPVAAKAVSRTITITCELLQSTLQNLSYAIAEATISDGVLTLGEDDPVYIGVKIVGDSRQITIPYGLASSNLDNTWTLRDNDLIAFNFTAYDNGSDEVYTEETI